VPSPGASPRPPQSNTDKPRIIVEGGFTNVRYTEEHAYGQEVNLWRQGNRLLGLFLFTDGLQADFHTGLLEHLRFNSATGELSFDAYASQFYFDGRLDKATIKGVLKRMHPVDGRQVAEERVVLKRNANLTNGMRDYLSEDEWNADANRVLKRLGPPRKYEATRRQGGKVRPLSGESALRPAILFSVTV
jgi:hypothetical protein